ncbi:hypothetical protein D3C72_1325400 [compost metagenome]
MQRRGAIGAAGFDQIGPHLADAEVGQADQRRQRKHDGDHHARHVANAKQHHHRHQVDEGGRGLHGVQHGAEELLCTVAACQQDAQRQANDDAEGERGQDQRQRDHGFMPDTQHADDQQRHDGPNGQGAAGKLPCHQGQDGNHRDHGNGGEQVFHAIERAVNRHTHGLEEGAEVRHDPGQAAVDPVLHWQAAVPQLVHRKTAVMHLLRRLLGVRWVGRLRSARGGIGNGIRAAKPVGVA